MASDLTLEQIDQEIRECEEALLEVWTAYQKTKFATEWDFYEFVRKYMSVQSLFDYWCGLRQQYENKDGQMF